MVFTDEGRNAIRNWLAGQSTSAYPTKMLWGQSTTNANISTTNMQEVLKEKAFTSTTFNINKQIQWEGLLYSTEETSSTVRQVGIANGDYFTTLDDCEATTGWNTSADMEVTLQTGSNLFREGTASLNILKTGSSATTGSVSKTVSSANFTDAYLHYWLYITDTTSVNKLASTDAIKLRFGSDTSGATDYYEWTKDRSDLTTGWNLLGDMNTSSADTTSGTPTVTASNYFMASLNFTASSVTTTAGEFIMDDIQSGKDVPFIVEQISPISKNNQFDIQTFVIGEVE